MEKSCRFCLPPINDAKPNTRNELSIKITNLNIYCNANDNLTFNISIVMSNISRQGTIKQDECMSAKTIADQNDAINA